MSDPSSAQRTDDDGCGGIKVECADGYGGAMASQPGVGDERLLRVVSGGGTWWTAMVESRAHSQAISISSQVSGARNALNRRPRPHSSRWR